MKIKGVHCTVKMLKLFLTVVKACLGRGGSRSSEEKVVHKEIRLQRPKVFFINKFMKGIANQSHT